MRKGFTLIELMVTVFIITVLLILGISIFGGDGDIGENFIDTMQTLERIEDPFELDTTPSILDLFEDD